MTLNLVEKIPFKDVYIHGLVRDSEGQKMSKTKGNVLDPLDFEDSKVVLALKIQRATRAAKPRLETYGLDADERAAWRQVMDDLAACRFEGHRGDELLADACIDRLGLIEAKRLSAL